MLSHSLDTWTLGHSHTCDSTATDKLRYLSALAEKMTRLGADERPTVEETLSLFHEFIEDVP